MTGRLGPNLLDNTVNIHLRSMIAALPCGYLHIHKRGHPDYGLRSEP